MPTKSVQQGILEEQLADGRLTLFDTVEPGLADIAAHALYEWVIESGAGQDILTKSDFPKTVRVSDINLHPTLREPILVNAPATVDETDDDFREGHARKERACKGH